MWIRLACVQRLYELIAIIGGWADLYSCWHDFFCNRVVISIIWFTRGGERCTCPSLPKLHVSQRELGTGSKTEDVVVQY